MLTALATRWYKKLRSILIRKTAMKRIFALLLALASLLTLATVSTQAITSNATLMVTNAVALTNATFTLNGSKRSWTNSPQNALQMQIPSDTGTAATNLYYNAVNANFGTGIQYQVVTNTVNFLGCDGCALSFSNDYVGWGKLTITVNTGSSTFPVQYPMGNLSPASATQQAAQVVADLQAFGGLVGGGGTNPFSAVLQVGNNTLTGIVVSAKNTDTTNTSHAIEFLNGLVTSTINSGKVRTVGANLTFQNGTGPTNALLDATATNNASLAPNGILTNATTAGQILYSRNGQTSGTNDMIFTNNVITMGGKSVFHYLSTNHIMGAAQNVPFKVEANTDVSAGFYTDGNFRDSLIAVGYTNAVAGQSGNEVVEFGKEGHGTNGVIGLDQNSVGTNEILWVGWDGVTSQIAGTNSGIPFFRLDGNIVNIEGGLHLYSYTLGDTNGFGGNPTNIDVADVIVDPTGLYFLTAGGFTITSTTFTVTGAATFTAGTTINGNFTTGQALIMNGLFVRNSTIISNSGSLSSQIGSASLSNQIVILDSSFATVGLSNFIASGGTGNGAWSVGQTHVFVLSNATANATNHCWIFDVNSTRINSANGTRYFTMTHQWDIATITKISSSYYLIQANTLSNINPYAVNFWDGSILTSANSSMPTNSIACTVGSTLLTNSFGKRVVFAPDINFNVQANGGACGLLTNFTSGSHLYLAGYGGLAMNQTGTVFGLTFNPGEVGKLIDVSPAPLLGNQGTISCNGVQVIAQ